MTKREEAKDLYLSALRGDVAAQRKCTANGKPCGGRCIPKHWNCRIRGEGDTPPTRGNEVQLSAAQKEKLKGVRARRRRNQALKTLAGAAGIAGAAVGAGYLASRNPQATRRVANRMGVMSNIAGMASNLPGPAGAAAGVVNMGVGAFQAGANMGASLAQNQRGRTRLRQLRGALAQTQSASRRMGESISKLKGKREVYERERSSLMTRMGTQGGTTAQRRSLRSLDTTLNRLTRQIQEKETARSVTTRRIASITKATRNIEGLLTGNYNTAEKVVRTIEQRTKDFRSGRRQTSNLRPQRRRGPKPDRRSWQERFGLDAEDQREDKKCGASAIEESKKCHKGSGKGRQVAKAAATAALVAGGAVALRQAGKAVLGKTKATPAPKGPWVASKGRRMTAKEIEALRKMRERGQGKYGAQPRRQTGDREDAAGEKRLGKPCGNSYISREYKCSVSTSGRGQDWGKAAMMVGAVAGGAVVAHELRRRSGDWWKDHKWPMSNEDADKLFEEAKAGGQKWDEFERRKAAYEAACAKADEEEQQPKDSGVQQLDLDLGKRKAPARLDGWRKANSCRGSGAFGNYYVHTSGKYGIKAFSDPDYDSRPEADMLEYANRIGVPAPQLLNYKGNAMVLEHLRGYKAVDSTNFGMGMQFGRDIPVEIKKNFIAAVRTMHLEGMAHNDLHMGNIMVGLASRRVKLIDFGLASLRSDTENAVPFRDGRGSNLLKEELSSIPYKLNLPDATINLVQTRYKRALQLVEDIADSENGYGRARNRSGINLHWDTAEFIINRYYNDLTRAVEAQPVARSRSVASIIQPKLPGFDRARLKARWNTEQAAGLQGWGKDALYDIAQQMGVAPSAFESFLLSAKNKK